MSDDEPKMPPGTKPVHMDLSEGDLATMAQPFFEAVDELRKQGVDRFVALAAIQYAAGAMMAQAGVFIPDDPLSIARAVEPLLHGWRTGSAMIREEARTRAH